MAHQTFYIDIDEEITTVVERLKKAKAGEIIMVVPKRALLIQSIINLRLLKKEAEGMGLQLMIVTQDKLGKLLIEKAGILVQQKMDDVAEEEMIEPSHPETSKNISDLSYTQTQTGDITENQSNVRLNKLGSDDFFHSPSEKPTPVSNQKELRLPPLVDSNEAEKITNKELVSDIGRDIKRVPAKNMDMGTSAGRNFPAQGLDRPDNLSWSPQTGKVGSYFPNEKSDRDQEKKIEHFFHPETVPPSIKPEKIRKKIDFSGLKKAALAFVVIAIFLGLGAAAYLFIPKADISLSIKQKLKEQDYAIKGDAAKDSADMESETIPAKVIDVTAEVTKNIPITGKKSSTSTQTQKARGTITIYNEFSPSSQPLVATTRFLSESGKLFRLANAVTVPGTEVVNGETKPGAIEAQVIADQSGEEYNIQAEKFTIPGFKDSGSGKYDKIYGKSSQTMSGGGATADSGDSQPRAITLEDINKAKADISSDLNDEIRNKISQGSSGYKLLDDAINNEEASYKTSKSAGEVADNFQITANTRAQAVVFSETDLKNMIAGLMGKSAGALEISADNLALQYGKSLPDVKNRTIDIKVHAVGKSDSAIDMEKFKQDIVGKSNEEFESYLSYYPDIVKAEVSYWPPFISKIPRYTQRINVALDSSE